MKFIWNKKIITFQHAYSSLSCGGRLKLHQNIMKIIRTFDTRGMFKIYRYHFFRMKFLKTYIINCKIYTDCLLYLQTSIYLKKYASIEKNVRDGIYIYITHKNKRRYTCSRSLIQSFIQKYT